MCPLGIRYVLYFGRCDITAAFHTLLDTESNEWREDIGVEIKAAQNGTQLLFVTAPEFNAEFEFYGNCPVQGFGTVLGREAYFRARHEGWFFEVADQTGSLPSDGSSKPDGFYREADFPNAGWKPHLVAVKIIAACLREYTDVRH